jgi:ribosomal protein S18 acetylase RimI-like enzyme
MANALITVSTAQGMAHVTLLADKDNRPALAFYERMGFAESAMRVLRKGL